MMMFRQCLKVLQKQAVERKPSIKYAIEALSHLYYKNSASRRATEQGAPRPLPLRRQIMKKAATISGCLLLVLSLLTACTNDNLPEETTKEENELTETEALSSETGPSADISEKASAEPLAMLKSFYSRQEWDGETLLAVSECSDAVMSDESAEKYPKLAEALEETNRMTQRSMEDEFDNLLSTAKEELTLLGADSFVTKESTLDVQIRRADSVAVSLLYDSTLVYGKINGRFLNGVTYNTQTGEKLVVTDVIKNMEKIPEAVEKELQSHSLKGDLNSETAVSDYFKETSADGISWTLDYNGVTFYFADGELADIGEGYLAATVTFAEHPELFYEKYMTVPEAYIVEIPVEHPFYADLDGDGTVEEISAVPVTDESGLFYKAIDIYSDTEAQYYHAELDAEMSNRIGSYQPYYVKASDGRHYLYVFAKTSELVSDGMKLHVVDITDGFKSVGDMHIAPGYVPTDLSYALTDPHNMMLENFELMEDVKAYHTGADGMPVGE